MALHWSLDIPRFGDCEQLSNWLQEQLGKCDDEAFGQRFAAACSVPGCHAESYQHRLLKVGGEALLVGIRFKGGDVTQPFVDLLAWTGTPRSSWIPAIAEAFSPFDPLAVRYCWSRPVDPPWTGEIDQHVVAGTAKGAPHGWVTSACDLSWFSDFRSSFDRWQRSDPLGPEVQPAEASELSACLNDGHVVIASYGGTFVGTAACRWDSERSFVGWTIVEEFVVPEWRGRKLGVALQRALMLRLPVGDLVWGTIHGKNAASLATAAGCGREVVETWWFTALRSTD